MLDKSIGGNDLLRKNQGAGFKVRCEKKIRKNLNRSLKKVAQEKSER